MNADQFFIQYFPNLVRKFSLKSFQAQVINKVLSKENTLGIMPTGGGKSLIYWVSALGLGGTTIVISPLTALIDEQASKLETEGYKVLVLHAGITQKIQITSLKKFYQGSYSPHFIFLSPERLATDGLVERAIYKRRTDIPLVVIDEVHCISQWGHSFRPFYTHIPNFLNNIFGSSKWPTILGLSATLNQLEVNDICNAFHIKSVLKDKLLMRSEIQLHTTKLQNEEEKENKLWNLLELHKGEKALVYVYRRSGKRSVEAFNEEAKNRGYHSTYFHSEVSSKDKQKIIQQFKDNELDIVFATNAFGMGIDIPDIRIVIHFMIPESIAQYYQEVGRASRDQKTSNAYLLYSDKNISVKKSHFIDKAFPNFDELKNAFEMLTSNKIGFTPLDYFDNDELQKCLPYFLEANIVEINGKAIQSLKILENNTNEKIQSLIDATKTKNLIATMKKTRKSANEISTILFDSLLNDEVSVSRSLNKCLVIESFVNSIDDYESNFIELNETKKKYKYEQLDYLVYQINQCNNSYELHQEIACYLGVNRFSLNKIYDTHQGEKVRSKSEVIIANTLYAKGITYKYEKELLLPNGEKMLPDFTLNINSNTYYLEHLGMIGDKSYDQRWLKKKNLYSQFYPENLVYTYESPALSFDILKLIEQLPEQKNYKKALYQNE